MTEKALTMLVCRDCGERQELRHSAKPCLKCGSLRFRSLDFDELLTDDDKTFLRTNRIIQGEN